MTFTYYIATELYVPWLFLMQLLKNKKEWTDMIVDNLLIVQY